MTATAAFPGLAQLIKQRYESAVKSGAVIFTDSSVEESEERGIPFEIRFAPQLAKKPTKDDALKADKPKDPFAPPYVDDLHVAEDSVAEDGQDEHFVILLNKFCLMPRHFLLVTKEFAPQTSPLTPAELAATYSILKQLGSREKFIAFYNSGEQSGASQPHKHLQFIPVTSGMAPFEGFIDEHKPDNPKGPFQLPLPYANFVSLLRPPAGRELTDYLGQVYLELLDEMIQHIRGLPTEGAQQAKATRISYNFVMTTSYMQLVPRSKECYVTPDGENVSINSLGFAGYVLTKTEAAREAVKKAGVLSVLQSIGMSTDSIVIRPTDPVDQ